jgi:sn-glycerol 3-phosphate transport system permease protein
MTNSEPVRTLPIGISLLRSAEGATAWNVIMSGNLMLVLPILVLFIIAQRHIINAFVYQSK